MGDLELNVNAYLPLRDVVFETLRDAILKGDIKPGERLMEMKLANKLGVSRTPIREAIRMLELEGLAVTVPRKGAEVARMTEKDMEDVLQIRESLEILAGSLSCDKATEEQLIQIEAEAGAFEEAALHQNLDEVVAADVRFHDAIYQATDNPKLQSMLSNLRKQVYRYRVEYLKDVEIYPRLIKEHRQIIEGLKNRDKEAVQRIIVRHMDNQATAVKNIIREQNVE